MGGVANRGGEGELANRVCGGLGAMGFRVHVGERGGGAGGIS